jgi:hypothetical protein
VGPTRSRLRSATLPSKVLSPGALVLRGWLRSAFSPDKALREAVDVMKPPAAEHTVPLPLSPGCEVNDLERFHRNGTWTGTIRAGAIGAGSPEMIGTGRARFHWIQQGLWVVGDFEQDQRLPDGTFILRWELHWVAGWDPRAKEYRASTADNNGGMAIFRGRINGDVLVFESTDPASPQLRLTWDLRDPTAPKWRNEGCLDGTSWFLIEEYEIRFDDDPATTGPVR